MNERYLEFVVDFLGVLQNGYVEICYYILIKDGRTCSDGIEIYRFFYVCVLSIAWRRVHKVITDA